MKFTASSEKFLEERMPGVNVPPGHWMGTKEVVIGGRVCLHHRSDDSGLSDCITLEIT